MSGKSLYFKGFPIFFSLITTFGKFDKSTFANVGVVGSSPSGSIGFSLEITAFAASGFQQI